ncbi:MAG: undecaprenyldiphospho-muramoylpentapeptide beta-N-acetylglucosaminyltransferase [Alphaproteobacteria bacterium]|nr:undecaprenyldiphospho-muramoylpentapeptide beta-N-acetylglucosaminyltransferase [Alphaproteobacteria bacterium]
MAKIALAGGGTGGHVYPAIAIGDVLRERGHEVVYYGDPDRLEGRVAPEKGYHFQPVRALQYPRGGIVGKVRFAWGLLLAILATRSMLKRDGIDLVLGVGGYISAPPVLAAVLTGAKRAIHEANAVPGKANELCGRYSHLVLLTFERTRSRFPEGVRKELVGVPVNPKILDGDRQKARERYGLDADTPVVCFVGGSLGAARINELAIACAKASGREYQVLHLTGPRYYDEVKAAIGTVPPGVKLVDYENRMADAYAAADLLVCRAGSATLAEICAVGKPSLLVPSPNVTENHQEENARGLEDAGAAVVVVEEGWDLDANVARVAALLDDSDGLERMAAGARGLAKLDAAAHAADLVEQLLA